MGMPAPDVPRTGFLFCHGRSNKQEYTIYNEAWSGGDLLAGHGSLGLDRYVFRNADPGTQQYRRTTNKALQAQEQTIGSMGDRRRTGWSGHGCMPDRMQCNDTHPWLQQRLGPGCPPSHVPPRLLLRCHLDRQSPPHSSIRRSFHHYCMSDASVMHNGEAGT